MTPPLSPAIEAAIQTFEESVEGFWNRYGMLHAESAFVDDARDALRAAILAEQQALLGRIERLSARLDECERGVVEP